MTLDELLKDTCHTILERNPHAGDYKTRRQWVEGKIESDLLDGDVPTDLDEWPALWSAHIYVRTPIGFATGIGPTPEAAVEAAFRSG